MIFRIINKLGYTVDINSNNTRLWSSTRGNYSSRVMQVIGSSGTYNDTDNTGSCLIIPFFSK